MQGDSIRGIEFLYYEANPSWDLVDSSWSSESVYESKITFKLTLRRKPLYAILTIVFPVQLLCLLNILAFALPSDGGEQSGYAVTMFLAFVVFLTIVESTLPPSSESISVFSVYIILMTSMSTFITLIVVVENRCSSWEVNEVPIPRLVICLADVGRLMPCRRSCRKRTNRNKVIDIDPEVNVKVTSTSELEKKYNWKTVICGFDRLCQIGFTIYAILRNFLLLLIASLLSS